MVANNPPLPVWFRSFSNKERGVAVKFEFFAPNRTRENGHF